MDYDIYGRSRPKKVFPWVDGFKPKATSRGFTGHQHAEAVKPDSHARSNFGPLPIGDIAAAGLLVGVYFYGDSIVE